MVFTFDKLKEGINKVVGKNETKKDDDNNKSAVRRLPFTFEDTYRWPTLFEEADAMNLASLLIYTITDLRSLAKKEDTQLKNPERILTLPLKLQTCLEMIQENEELIKTAIGDEHDMVVNALQSIKQRYERLSSPSSSPSGGGGGGGGGNSTNTIKFFNPFVSQAASSDGSIEIQNFSSPTLIAYGDDNPVSDLVYAVGVDPNHRRVTVAFRGSVTTTDFLTDAMIVINRQPNPVLDCIALDDDEKDKEEVENQSDTIGIHHGFFNYLLKIRKDGTNKYSEILSHVTTLFEDPTFSSYKLYVTGHSLGGALATLFSFHVAASSLQKQQHTDGDASSNKVENEAASLIPTPITCVSIASPRVGEGSFQRAFRLLERRGLLRHLRIANDRDPVTMMPKSSGKLVWSAMSPISYAAFKVMDRNFVEKETFCHTGIKLKLNKKEEIVVAEEETEAKKEDERDRGLSDDNIPPLFEIEYSSAGFITKETENEKTENKDRKVSKSAKLTKSKKSGRNIPDAVFHMTNAYCDNLENVKDTLVSEGTTLNGLYKIQAAAATINAAK